MWMKYQSKYENTVYAVLWGLLFVAPVLALYVRTVSDDSQGFDWAEVWLVWRRFAIYLALFLIHNFLLAPLLIHGRKRGLYLSAVVMILAGFAVYQCSTKPDDMGPWHRQALVNHGMNHGDRPHDLGEPRSGRELRHDDHRPGPPPAFRRHRPPVFIGEHNIVAIVVVVLMFGANLGTKYYFRSRMDRKRLQALEKQNLEQQLEYLRYQINPHFFMNTLNNIHALVDIDPEKAKDTILELSKMMRFVLYEGNKQGVPLSREMDFVRHYIALMKLRYTDKVRITTDLPQEVPDRQIPPLILITFIENAFKHGVSYQNDSFIEVKIAIEDERMAFTCRNSKTGMTGSNEKKGGVGLANVRKRLNLLYPHDYTLRIKDAPDAFIVELNIPLA